MGAGAGRFGNFGAGRYVTGVGAGCGCGVVGVMYIDSDGVAAAESGVADYSDDMAAATATKKAKKI